MRADSVSPVHPTAMANNAGTMVAAVAAAAAVFGRNVTKHPSSARPSSAMSVLVVTGMNACRMATAAIEISAQKRVVLRTMSNFSITPGDRS